jgi:hypothetical protein
MSGADVGGPGDAAGVAVSAGLFAGTSGPLVPHAISAIAAIATIARRTAARA